MYAMLWWVTHKKQETVDNLQIWYLGANVSKSVPTPSINEMSEIEVYRNYLTAPCIGNTCEDYVKGFYLADSAHYDFVAFGAISSLTKYTFLKGSIDYADSLKANNRFNLEALRQSEITTDTLVIQIEK